MTELVRDSIFGHLVRLVSGGKLFPYPEDRDPEQWKNYISYEKTARIANHGHTREEYETKEKKNTDNDEASRIRDQRRPSPATIGSSDTHVVDRHDTNQFGHRLDPEKGRNLNVVDFQENDPANPRNWSLTKKVVVTGLISLLTTSIYMGSSIYTPGTQEIVEEFGVSPLVATLGLTLFVAGYGVAPMIFSPMSEVPFIGRNPIYIGTLLIFVCLQFPIVYAKNIGTVLAFRFLTGFFGSPVLATGGASVGDIWRPQKRAYAMAIWGLFAVCGPTLGPVVGGFAAQHKDWTWTIWELIWLSSFTFLVLFFLLPETSSANILFRRAKRLRKLTGNPNLISEPELEAAEMSPAQILSMALVKPFTLNFTEPIVFFINLYVALIYGLLYLWFESFNIVFVETYGFSVSIQGLAFLGLLVGAVVSVPPFFWYLRKKVEPQFNEGGEIKPEHRLPPAIVGAFFIPVCLFWFGWSARADVHWIVPIIGSACFSIGAVLVFNSVLNYLTDAYPEVFASVLAGNDLFRSAFGASFPLFASAMYNKLGVDWASTLLGFLGILFIPIPFVLYKYGEAIRRRSKHARHDL